MADVVVNGGTGYLGQRLVRALIARGHQVRVLARPQSLSRVPAGAMRVVGDALDAGSVAARGAGVSHFIYVSVAHPAPIMQAYIDARVAGEAAIREAGLTATVLRPWYVLGPGHRWAAGLLPLYWVLELIPSTKGGHYKALLGRSVDGIFTAAGSGVKSSPGLMKRSASSVYCLSYNVRYRPPSASSS